MKNNARPSYRHSDSKCEAVYQREHNNTTDGEERDVESIRVTVQRHGPDLACDVSIDRMTRRKFASHPATEYRAQEASEADSTLAHSICETNDWWWRSYVAVS
jgi:hypothetical protein